MAASGARLRAEAARAVHAVRVDGRSLDTALAYAEQHVGETDRALLRHLCYECLRHHWQLRGQLGVLLSKPLARRDAIVEDLLAIGLTQLQHTRIKPHAVVSETVEAARRLRRPRMAGLVNAVLRRYQRETPQADTPEARSNHPAWLLAHFAADWPDQADDIVAANQQRAPMWLRINQRHGSVDDWLARHRTAFPDLAPADIEPGFEAAVRLAVPQAVDELPGFGDGHVSVQDAAAQLAAPWLLHDGGERVLYACAAPGGKTAHLSELAGPAAALTAIDSDSERLERVRETLARTGGSATVLHADASNTETWWDGTPFDRILLDAPCSATGVIRRHPDIALLRRADDIDALAARQAALLASLWQVLAPGGRLLYVTCSVLAAENDHIVGRFLANQSDAHEESVLPNNNIRALMERKPHGWQLLPGTRGVDGFYYASLRKDT